jgi:hypothetical protein
MSIPDSEKPHSSHFFVKHCWAINKVALAFNSVMFFFYLSVLSEESPNAFSNGWLSLLLLFLCFLINSIIFVIGTFTSLIGLYALTYAKSNREMDCLVSSILSILGMSVIIYIFAIVYYQRSGDLTSVIAQGYSFAFFVILTSIAVMIYRKRIR